MLDVLPRDQRLDQAGPRLREEGGQLGGEGRGPPDLEHRRGEHIDLLRRRGNGPGVGLAEPLGVHLELDVVWEIRSVEGRKEGRKKRRNKRRRKEEGGGAGGRRRRKEEEGGGRRRKEEGQVKGRRDR